MPLPVDCPTPMTNNIHSSRQQSNEAAIRMHNSQPSPMGMMVNSPDPRLLINGNIPAPSTSNNCMDNSGGSRMMGLDPDNVGSYPPQFTTSQYCHSLKNICYLNNARLY